MRTVLLVIAALAACNNRKEPPPHEAPKPTPGPSDASSGTAPAPSRAHDAIARMDFNRWAVRQNLPVYWIADANNNKQLEPTELASLLFYPTAGKWVTDGKLTADFEAAYDAIVAAAKAPAPDASTPEGKRQKLVGDDLDQGRPTLVRSDLAALSSDDKAFVGHMLNVSNMIDKLYEQMNGAAAFVPKLPADPASRSLFRRNRGPKCVAPLTEKDPLCSAVPGGAQVVFDLYPVELQKDAGFCAALAKAPNAKDLMAPFTVVRGTADKLEAKPYTDAYKEQTDAIAAELTAAAASVKDATEKPLVDYLRAAAASFTSNDWQPADEAWAKMTVENSKWYVRVAPDEVYWEPCSLKAGMHVTFARINQGSRTWQQKLVPVQQEMEAAIAERAGKPYAARKVTFHLPDFIDIIVNAGDDRDPLGATIGQSLPNWGPVANEGRGRTVAMTNLYTDPDSSAARRQQAESMLDAASMKAYAGGVEPGLLNTILHEATHNLGPAHEYKVGGKTASEIFTGPIASFLEELKAQTGALFLIEFLRAKKLISDELAAQTYADGIVWAFGHISQGMYDGDGKRKTYSNLAAVQIGFLREKGVLVWDDKAPAANGKDTGAFTLHAEKIVPVVDELMRTVAGIKARGDKAGAKALLDKYVDSSKVVPHEIIKERFLRIPKASFVYAVVM
jgi:hypothetical protein